MKIEFPAIWELNPSVQGDKGIHTTTLHSYILCGMVTLTFTNGCERFLHGVEQPVFRLGLFQ